MTKKCYKSAVDKKFAGVCGGIAEYFEIDSTLVRLLWIVLSLMAGSGLLAYIIAAIVMPDRPEGGYYDPYRDQNPYQGQSNFQNRNNYQNPYQNNYQNPYQNPYQNGDPNKDQNNTNNYQQ